MEYLVNAEQMKEYDRVTIEEYGVPSLVLMERAALMMVKELQDGSFDLKKVLVVCGAGNNGGDGFSVARLLHLQNIETAVLFAGKEESMTEETRIQKKICENYGIKIFKKSHLCEYTCIEYMFQEYTCIIDAIFGVGLSRPVAGEYAELIGGMNRARVKILAADIPSGISADTGTVLGTAVKADKTVAFAFKKIGHVLYPGVEYCGKIVIGDIGITKESLKKRPPVIYSLTAEDRAYMPKRMKYSNKGTYGRTLMIAGQKDMGGAAVLAGEAAYRTGTGIVSILTEECNRAIIQGALPEAILNTYESGQFLTVLKNCVGTAAAVGIGPGLGISREKAEVIQFLLHESSVPLVLDADALNMLSEHREILRKHQGKVVITPHVGEMMRLTGLKKTEVTDNIIEVCRSFAAEYDVICVLKDTRTVISDGHEVCINQTGCNGMASGGSGDVLAGMISGFLAQGAEAFTAAKIAVYLHGSAGEYAGRQLGDRGMLARDIVRAIPAVLKGSTDD